MIDSKWLQNVLNITTGPSSSRKMDQLAKALNEPDEVFPHIVTELRVTDGWPLTKAALKAAQNKAPRPGSMRGASQPNDAAYHKARETLFAWLHPLMVSRDVRWRPDWTASGPHVDDVVRAINHHRRISAPSSSPSIYVGHDAKYDDVALPTHVDTSSADSRTAEIVSALEALSKKSPFWWRFLSKKRRKFALRKEAEKRGLFDGEKYLARYPDVRAAGVDPLQHFIRFGHLENRFPF